MKTLSALRDRFARWTGPDPAALARGMIATRVGPLTWRYAHSRSYTDHLVRLLFSDDVFRLSDAELTDLGLILGLIPPVTAPGLLTATLDTATATPADVAPAPIAGAA